MSCIQEECCSIIAKLNPNVYKLYTEYPSPIVSLTDLLSPIIVGSNQLYENLRKYIPINCEDLNDQILTAAKKYLDGLIDQTQYNNEVNQIFSQALNP